MTIKTETLRMDGIPYRSTLLQQIPVLEFQILEVAANIGRLNKELKETHQQEALLRVLMSTMSLKTRQLLMYR